MAEARGHTQTGVAFTGAATISLRRLVHRRKGTRPCGRCWGACTWTDSQVAWAERFRVGLGPIFSFRYLSTRCCRSAAVIGMLDVSWEN